MKPFLLLLSLPAACCGELVDVPEHGLRVQRGFRITQFSDEKLANDIWCMTLSPRGEVTVSGAGYIATLLDENGDGTAERAVEFTKTKGAMGLCFGDDGKQLLAMHDGWLTEFRDDNLDRIADGPPRKILRCATGEHGGHAIRKGPDGWWWVIAGNDAGIVTEFDEATKLADDIGIDIQTGGDPEKRPLAGALMRISPDLKKILFAADGFRNPYDFDFNERGDVFTYDSDCERDYFLPWHSGTRIYHVTLGRSHGWRLPGYQRSFRVPDYMPSAVPALADLGRGSPTGVLVPKAQYFPAHYRGGLFACDWTFGRIHFLPLVRRPAEDVADAEAKLASQLRSVLGGDHSAFALKQPYYVTQPEVFAEPLGSHGFAPTDIEQARDGSLLVSIGGRKTRGAVYRFTPTELGDTQPVVIAPPRKLSVELSVLEAVQAKLGGWKLTGASAELFVPYEPTTPRGLTDEQRTLATDYAQAALLSLDEAVQAEAARLLAMLEDDSEISASRVLAAISEKSTPTSDVHFLACYARMKAAPEITAQLAKIILRLDGKLAGGDRRPKQNWAIRLNELIARLAAKHGELLATLVAAPDFATPGRLALTELLDAPHRATAATKFLAAAKPDWPWSAELVNLIGPLPESRPVLLGLWPNLGLRKTLRPFLETNASPDELAMLNAKDPEPQTDTAPFIASLAAVAWDKGDAARGAKLFTERACATCHSGTSPIGPELSGPVTRLTAADLMTDIQFPSRNIADAFRATLFTMRDGSEIAGFIAFLSADGVIVQTLAGTQRLAESDILRRVESKTSLMPPSLLIGLQPSDLADLHAYLRTLAPVR